MQDKLNNYQNQLKGLDQTLSTQKQQENAAAQQASSLQASIDVLQATMQKNNQAIQEHQASISALKEEQAKLTAKRQEDIRVLSNYLRTQYENGNDSYLNLLFQATSVEDFLTKLDYTRYIINAYGKLGDQIAADSKALEMKQQNEQAETAKLTQAVQSQQQIESSLQSTLTKQTATLNSLSAAQRQTVAAQTKVRRNINDTEALIRQQELEAELAAKNPQQQAEQKASDQQTSKISGLVGINATTAQFLAYAESFLGTPYAWGGTSPGGFDCSGYVQYVYAHFGVKLYRVSENQYQEGQSVQAGDLQPGDLVFFSTYAPGASHVGIYVGNRMMIDSSNNGVAYDSLDNPYWAARYLGARRIIGQ